MNKQKGISTTLSILLIVLLIVIVGGGVVYKYYLSPGEEPSAGEPGEPQDETTDWKIYRNEEYGFEIKYSDDWYEKHYYHGDIVELQSADGELYISTGGPCANCIEDEGARVSISVKYNPQETPLSEFLYWCSDKDTFSCENMSIAGTNAMKVTRLVDFGAGWPSIYISKEDRIFVISFAKTITNKDYLPIFDQMLSTFKFLDGGEPIDYSPENYSFDKQQVGEPTDGQGLNLIRHADHENYYRFVFDITDQYGSEEDYLVIPSTEAFYAHSAKTIGLIINGIRRDLTGNQVEKPIMVNHEVVASYIRNKIYDDQAIGYTIALNKDAKFYLHALTDPIRIILDVEK